ncbi:hypothetical protein KM043_009175 [Ampulex compressa]|nr:hypothetical protein KM043_009175 [Ampulex compressa]
MPFTPVQTPSVRTNEKCPPSTNKDDENASRVMKEKALETLVGKKWRKKVCSAEFGVDVDREIRRITKRVRGVAREYDVQKDEGSAAGDAFVEATLRAAKALANANCTASCIGT